MSARPTVALAVLCVWAATGATAVVAQEQWIAKAVHPIDWGLEDVSRLTSGQISLIDGPEGPRLEVYRLNGGPPPDFPVRVQSRQPSFTRNSFIVADFAHGIRNRVGGYFDAFEQAPSRASAALAMAPDGRAGLRLSYGREERGFCGVWVHFFDVTKPPHERVFLDASSAATLSFWVRGKRGGERVLVKLADERWERLGDAVPLGEVGGFLPSGQVEPEWQQAVIPLGQSPDGIGLSALASLVLEGIAPKRGEIYISRLALSAESGPLPSLPGPPAWPDFGEASPRAIWIWNTVELLDTPSRQDSLVRFLAAQGFDTAFLQLVSGPGDGSPVGGIDPDPRTRDLVAGLHAVGIRVYALDGFKRYAFPEYHPAVLATIRNVARYNSGSTESERFFGVRYDIEPYLLPGFHGPRRGEILSGYLEVLARGASVARENGLRFGADIPFWYDAPDEVTFEPVTAVFRGVEKPVSEHVIDLVDDVAIMDYRTTAYGADGIIRHAEAELRYASQKNRPTYVALETGQLPNETLIEFGGDPVKEPLDGRYLSGHVGLAPFGDSVLVIWRPRSGQGIVEGSEPGGLEDLALRGVEPRSVLWWQTTRRISVPAEKLSFAGLGVRPLREALDESARELAGYEAFAGFAIHYSESYLDLLEPEIE